MYRRENSCLYYLRSRPHAPVCGQAYSERFRSTRAGKCKNKTQSRNIDGVYSRRCDLALVRMFRSRPTLARCLRCEGVLERVHNMLNQMNFYTVGQIRKRAYV